MYVPNHFEETRTEVLHAIIAARPFGTLVLVRDGRASADHLPFELAPDPAPLGTLRGHVSRANPAWRDAAAGCHALIVFQDVDAYVSPSWYATKNDTGRVVPTWNYAVVHAEGRLQAVDDREWLRGLVQRLTERHESGFARPWRVADVPADYMEAQLRGIVGLELTIERLIGKVKASQNKSAADRAGVVAGLRRAADPASERMARWVETGNPEPDRRD